MDIQGEHGENIDSVQDFPVYEDVPYSQYPGVVIRISKIFMLSGKMGLCAYSVQML